MYLSTNRISTGKAGRFEDFIKNFRASQVKTASVKTAGEQEEADSSGQLKVEPLHQTGESTTMPKNGPSAKKDDGEKAATVNTDTEKDGEDSDQPAWEGKQENNNKPEVDKEAGCGKGKGPGEGKGDGKGDGSGTCDCGKEDCKACMAKTKATEKTAGELPEALKEHQFKAKGEKGEDTEEKDEEKEAKTDEEDKEEKEASSSVKFVKWANLDSKNKSFLSTYWRQLFGDDYVNALVADK